MAEVQIRNILVGAGNMFTSNPRDRGDASQELPAFTSEGPEADLDADEDWRYIGATQDGVEIAYTPETGEVEIDQQKTPALVYNTGLDVTMNTNLAEASLDNLALSWGLDETTIDEDAEGTATFEFGTPGDFYSERSIAVVGNAPPTATGDARERVYLARRVISAEGSTHTLSRTEATIFDVSFRVLEDPAHPGSEFGQIIDLVPPAP